MVKKKVFIGSCDDLLSAAVSELELQLQLLAGGAAVPGHSAGCAQKVDVSVVDRVGIS